MGAVERLRTKEAGGMNWTAIITGFFFDWGLKVGFAGFNVKSHSADIWDSGRTKFSATNIPTIGKALVNLLTSPEKLDAAKNRHVVISSFSTTQEEVLKTFEKVTGEKWTVKHVDAEKAGKEAQEKAAKGELNIGTFAGLLLSAGFGPLALADHEKGGTDNDLLLPGNNENLEELLKTVVAEVK